MLETFSKALQKRLDKRINELQESLGSGGATDFASYRHTCGIIAGLKYAKDQAIEARKTLLQEEDDDDDPS